MNSIILLILGITIAPVFSGFPTFEGRCPTAEVDFVPNFNQKQFAGFWYIIERYEQFNIMSCSRFKYTWNNETREFQEKLLQRGRTPENPEYITTTLTRSVINEKEQFSNNGKFLHRASVVHFQDYQFVDTDYENYAVLWTCLQRIGSHEQNLIVMARDKFFDINSSETLNATLAKAQFDRSLLKKIDQTNELCQSMVL